MDFTAIDFETANYQRESACQLAAVRVESGQVVDRQVWLIRPRPFFFSYRNIAIHGIEPHQVEDEPEFGELWPRISHHFDSTCLVAHNAPFDIGVLVACLKAHSLCVPEFQFTCTRMISRAVWPGQSGYGLKRIADSLGIQFKHHDALEDAEACARILLAAAGKSATANLEELESQYRLHRGQANATEYRGAKKDSRRRTIFPTHLEGLR